LLWHADEIARDAVVGLVLRPATRPRLTITQACRPVSEILTVTRASGNWILGLDGEPALDVYEACSRENPLLDLPVPEGRNLLVGLDGRATAGPGSSGEPARIDRLLVRNVVGADPRRRAFSIPGPVSAGQRLALLARDPEGARRDFADRLTAMSASASGPPPRFGIYFNCRARGQALFGEAGVEAQNIANAFPSCPISGAVGSCQFAPLAQGEPIELLTYAGALVLVDP
jgi:small ligand-binding sensory domain FIST